MGMEFGTELAGEFYFGISHEVLVTMSAEAAVM